MSFRKTVRQLPVRLAVGAFVLNSGLSKRDADEATAKQLHGFASGAYPFLGEVEPRTFTRLLSTGEIVVGAALLAPIVPAGLAGMALAAFSGGLLGLYLRTPGMRQEGSLRPTHQGTALAKDVWMMGVATSLIVDDLLEPSRRRRARK